MGHHQSADTRYPRRQGPHRRGGLGRFGRRSDRSSTATWMWRSPGVPRPLATPSERPRCHIPDIVLVGAHSEGRLDLDSIGDVRAAYPAARVVLVSPIADADRRALAISHGADAFVANDDGGDASRASFTPAPTSAPRASRRSRSGAPTRRRRWVGRDQVDRRGPSVGHQVHLGEPGRRMPHGEHAAGAERAAVDLDDVAAAVDVLAVIVSGEDDQRRARPRRPRAPKRRGDPEVVHQHDVAARDRERRTRPRPSSSSAASSAGVRSSRWPKLPACDARGSS